MSWPRAKISEHMSEALDGRLSPQEDELFRAGLAEHDDLAREYEALKEQRQTLLEIGIEKAPAGILEAIRKDLRDDPNFQGRDENRVSPWSHLQAMGVWRAAALLLVFITVAGVLWNEAPWQLPVTESASSDQEIDPGLVTASGPEASYEDVEIADRPDGEVAKSEKELEERDVESSLRPSKAMRKSTRPAARMRVKQRDRAEAKDLSEEPEAVEEGALAAEPPPTEALPEATVRRVFEYDGRAEARFARNLVRLRQEQLARPESQVWRVSRALDSDRTSGLRVEQAVLRSRVVLERVLAAAPNLDDEILEFRGLSLMARDLDQSSRQPPQSVPASPSKPGGKAGRRGAAKEARVPDRAIKPTDQLGELRADKKTIATTPQAGGAAPALVREGPLFLITGKQVTARVAQIIAQDSRLKVSVVMAPSVPTPAATLRADEPSYRLLEITASPRSVPALVSSLEALKAARLRVLHPPSGAPVANLPADERESSSGEASGRVLLLILDR